MHVIGTSLTGTKNANVLPDPVFAPPRTSKPRRPGRIEHLWISVGISNLASLRPNK